jgi:DNA-directed RNA polymerase I subunit RPA12
LRERRGKSKMMIKERCPKCDHPEMKYFVMQTRSVDEGSTVFYECEKCAYQYSLNN